VQQPKAKTCTSWLGAFRFRNASETVLKLREFGFAMLAGDQISIIAIKTLRKNMKKHMIKTLRLLVVGVGLAFS
jgi:hypothetical protein